MEVTMRENSESHYTGIIFCMSTIRSMCLGWVVYRGDLLNRELWHGDKAEDSL